MEPYLQTYFSKAITRGVNENGDASDDEGASNDNDADDPKGKNNKKKQANNVVSIPQICELIYELNQICPALVQSTIPMIEFKLKSNEEKERCEYTKLLARLFSDKNSELAVRYQEIWKSFLGRFRDINVTVRVRCVQYSMHFLVNHPELRMDITEQLRQRQHDADENVRYEVVMAIISAGKKGIENINECLLEFVKVRRAAFFKKRIFTTITFVCRSAHWTRSSRSAVRRCSAWRSCTSSTTFTWPTTRRWSPMRRRARCEC